MKRLYSILCVVVLTTSLSMAQMIDWFYGSVPDDWKTNPVPKKTYQIWQAPATFDPASSDVMDVWNLIPYEDSCVFYIDATSGKRAPASKADLTATFKTIYDADNLYVLLHVYDDFIEKDSIVEEWEVQWATYPDSLKMAQFPGKDTVTQKKQHFFNPKQAVAYWTATGSYKSSINIKGSLGYINYSKAYAGNINWGGAGAELGLSYKYTKVSNTEYTLMYIIPFLEGMAGFTASPDTMISLEVKVMDRDPNKKTIQASGNTANNNVYQSMFFAGKGKFMDKTVGINNNVAQTTRFSVYPNPASDVLRIRNYEQLSRVVINNLVGQEVRSFDVVTESLNVKGLTKGVYMVRMIDKSNNQHVEKIMVR